MRQAAQEAKSQERVITGCHHGGCIAESDQDHEYDQQAPAGPVCAEQSEDGRSYHHAQCIGADRVRGDGFGNCKVCRVERQQAHRGKLRRADRESAEGEREDDESDATR